MPLSQKHVQHRLIRASVRLDGTFVNFAVFVHGLNRICITGNDFPGRIVLDLKRLCYELCRHLIAENNVEYGIAASVGRNNGYLNVFATDIAFDKYEKKVLPSFSKVSLSTKICLLLVFFAIFTSS